MTAGRATRVATFCLLLIAGLVALLFAVRLAAAAFELDFSPFVVSLDEAPAAWAWILAAAFVVIAALVGLVLRHGDDMLWLPGEAGGVLLSAVDLQDAVETVARDSHPDALSAAVDLTARRGNLSGRLRMRARPLADVGSVTAAVEAAVRRKVVARTGRDLSRLTVRVRVVTVPQLKRHLP